MVSSWTQAEKEAVESFPRVSEEFCRLIEAHCEYDREQFFQRLAVQLAQVCAVAAQLPIVEPHSAGEESSKEEAAKHGEKFGRLLHLLRKKTGDLDEYWAMFDPTKKKEPCGGSLAGDLAEIYLDLHDALDLYRDAGATNDVYWEWRFDFWSHWSRHAADALKVILLSSGWA
ncbi:MAG TPA: DUF5063 domain-containing protein [Candidatus Acidoferrum sp.]|nr:DUF5063 domain-containing protein [Candidatus Acidoferrum sp.]